MNYTLLNNELNNSIVLSSNIGIERKIICFFRKLYKFIKSLYFCVFEYFCNMRKSI